MKAFGINFTTRRSIGGYIDRGAARCEMVTVIDLSDAFYMVWGQVAETTMLHYIDSAFFRFRKF